MVMRLDDLVEFLRERSKIESELLIDRNHPLGGVAARVLRSHRSNLDRLTWLDEYIQDLLEGYDRRCEIDVRGAVCRTHERLAAQTRLPRYRFCSEVIVDCRNEIVDEVISSHTYYQEHLQPHHVVEVMETIDRRYRRRAASPLGMGSENVWLDDGTDESGASIFPGHTPDTWIIQKIRVDPELQGLGVATRLVDALVHRWPGHRWGTTLQRDEGAKLFAHLSKRHPDKGF